jgi:hypothetical protein
MVGLRDEVCVRVEEGQTEYRVRIDGQDGGGFALRRAGAGERLPFSVVWDSHVGPTERRDSPGAVGIFGVSGASCGVLGRLASFEVQVSRSDLLAAIAGSYQGGIIVEISAP